MIPFDESVNFDGHAWLQAEIEKEMAKWRKENHGKDYWRSPLVRVAWADDELFEKLREVVDENHAMPQEMLPGARSVIVYFVPFRRKLGKENDRHDFYASYSWAEAYVLTNQLIEAMNLRLKAKVEEKGHRAVITPATHNFDEKKLISGWSHKHVGYIAGLGTFGLHQMLITRAGSCGRLGSLITTLPISASRRPEQEFCLFKAGKECSVCADKCKFGALHSTHFDRHRCYRQCLRNDGHYADLPLVDVCGKCVCEVPCSYGIPAEKAVSGD